MNAAAHPMPDLSSEFLIPNAFGLVATDFNRDMDGYRAALGFLSDLAGGTDHDKALEGNGGSPALLRAWQGSDKFRRVYAKCRKAGDTERAHAAQVALRARESDPAATEDGEGSTPPGQRFIPLEDIPVLRSAFRQLPVPASWGDA